MATDEPNNMDVSNKKPKSKKKLILTLLVIIVVGGVGYLGYSYMQAKKDVERLSNPQEAAKQQTEELVVIVGKIVELPSNETPTVATVSDVTKLQSQAFFVNADNGDKVLIYTQAKKAILYRPSTNKIINVAPLNIGQSSQPQSTTEQTQE